MAELEKEKYDKLKQQIEVVLEGLTERERKVLQLRFGLEDGRGRTLEEVGHEIEVTRERIRQIEAKALRKLRHPTRAVKLKDYLEPEQKTEDSPIELVEVLEVTEKLSPQLINYLKEHHSELHKVNWDVFEHLIGEFFASWGYEDVRLVGRDPTTSADIYAVRKSDPSGVPIRYFIEVKHVKDKIGVNVIDQVLGAVLDERPRIGWHLGMIVSIAGFTNFRKYTRHELAIKGIELRDYDDISSWLRDYKPSDKGLWLPDPLRKL